MDNKEYSSKKEFKDYKDNRFKFVLTVTSPNKENSLDTNIICERYFSINGFDVNKIDAFEMKKAVDHVVDLINEDLKSKSRLHLWYYEDTKYLDEEEENKRNVKQESFFTFTFFVDNKPFISRQWSAENYQQFIRNSVDLTNKKYRYNNSDSSNMDYINQILKKMSVSKQYFYYKLTNGKEIETCYPLKSKTIYLYSITDSKEKIYLDRNVLEEQAKCSDKLNKVIKTLDNQLKLEETLEIKFLRESGLVYKPDLIPMIINTISDTINTMPTNKQSKKNTYSCATPSID